MVNTTVTGGDLSKIENGEISSINSLDLSNTDLDSIINLSISGDSNDSSAKATLGKSWLK